MILASCLLNYNIAIKEDLKLGSVDGHLEKAMKANKNKG